MSLTAALLGILGAIIGGFVLFVKAFNMGAKQARTQQKADESDARKDLQNRTNDAINAGNRVDTAPDRLRDNDGYRRD